MSPKVNVNEMLNTVCLLVRLLEFVFPVMKEWFSFNGDVFASNGKKRYCHQKETKRQMLFQRDFYRRLHWSFVRFVLIFHSFNIGIQSKEP